MTKEQIVAYIRNQAFFYNLLADEIEAGKVDKDFTAAWAIDLNLPEEFKQEVHARLQQEELHAEHNESIEKGEVA